MDLAFIAKRLDAYERLIRLDKPIGTLLLLWPTLWALWLASRRPPAPRHRAHLRASARCSCARRAARSTTSPTATSTATSSARAAARSPPARSGRARRWSSPRCSPPRAFVLVLFLNRLAIALSFVALAIAVIYPFTKRFFALPQAWLGVAFGFGIPMAYAAIQWRLPRGMLGAVRGQPVLGLRLRHRVRDGRSRRRRDASASAPRRSRSGASTSPR